jgi:dolichyl-phosphate-mannose--protein O-mannosyl transferase
MGNFVWQTLRISSQFFTTIPLRGLTIYIVVNYGVSLLPWLAVSRCTFFYHYLPAYGFSILALALVLETLLQQPQTHYRVMAFTCLALVAIAFWYWFPVFLGLPLTPQGFSLRMIFPSWI